MTQTLSFTLKIDREKTKDLVAGYLINQDQITEKERAFLSSVSCENGELLVEFSVEIKNEENA